MKTFSGIILLFIAVLLTKCSSVNPSDPSYTTGIPALRKQRVATVLHADNKPVILLGGELHNSTTGGIEYMRPIWKKMAENNLNAVIGTASWELVEPEEGSYDFELVDSMILGARKQGLRLVIIWFGSWKNSESTYAPAWVKLDQDRFPLVKDESGSTLNIITPLCEEASKADARAFAAMMKHIRQFDSRYHTVLAIQVENEMGTLHTKRDFSEAANKAFTEAVPAELMIYFEKNRSSVHRGVFAAWEKNGLKNTGTWEEVFGKGELLESWKDLSYLPEELFMAWNYAKYVERIAAAGKAEYNIPMYVNAWLKQPGRSGHAPGNYPSGGPTPHVLDVWRAGAPSIDFIAPDIYIVDEFRYICDQYTLSGNPLFIPETTGDASSAARAFFAFGRYNTICYAPFGIDGNGTVGADVNSTAEIKDAYGTLKQLTPYIIHYQGSENLGGLLVDDNSRIDSVTLGGYKIKGYATRRYDPTAMGMPGGNQQAQPQRNPAGGALIISTEPGEYLIAGRNMGISFSDADQSSKMKVSFISLEEGRFVEGNWVPGRRLNGDEFRVVLPANRSMIYKVKLYKY